jgi:hypothetical protein
MRVRWLTDAPNAAGSQLHRRNIRRAASGHCGAIPATQNRLNRAAAEKISSPLDFAETEKDAARASHALAYSLRMIFSENRCTLFRITRRGCDTILMSDQTSDSKTSSLERLKKQ